MQALHSIDLSNRVLQCCILISRGKEEHALQIAETLSSELPDWLGSVFEAFGCINQALKLSRLSTAHKINMCIKVRIFVQLVARFRVAQHQYKRTICLCSTTCWVSSKTRFLQPHKAIPQISRCVLCCETAK